MFKFAAGKVREMQNFYGVIPEWVSECFQNL